MNVEFLVPYAVALERSVIGTTAGSSGEDLADVLDAGGGARRGRTRSVRLCWAGIICGIRMSLRRGRFVACRLLHCEDDIVTDGRLIIEWLYRLGLFGLRSRRHVRLAVVGYHCCCHCWGLVRRSGRKCCMLF
jgi:hypothetical protein